MTSTKAVLFMLFFAGLLLFLFLIMQPLQVLQFRQYIDILFPSGIIGLDERNLLFIIQALMLLIVIPVYILTFIFSWKYRADNPKGKYEPDLVDNTLAEVIWWGLPLVMTIAVSILTWIKTEQLDPFKPIQSPNKTLTVQAVALQWKWLFIYPEEKIAVVNFLQIPEQTPIHFEITADAPMNSLWIPKLGGQIYAMPKMKTELNLIANETGDFRGSSANLSGEGFAGMHFITRATTQKEYLTWLESAKDASQVLDIKEYEKLAAPSQNNAVAIYKLGDDALFEHILMKFMHPAPKDAKESE